VAYDILAQKGGAQLLSQLLFLYESVTSGEGEPTQGMREVADQLATRQRGLAGELADLEAGPLAEVERLARDLGVPRVVLPGK